MKREHELELENLQNLIDTLAEKLGDEEGLKEPIGVEVQAENPEDLQEGLELAQDIVEDDVLPLDEESHEEEYMDELPLEDFEEDEEVIVLEGDDEEDPEEAKRAMLERFRR